MRLPDRAPFTLSFSPAEGLSAACYREKDPVFSLTYENGKVKVLLSYDADPRPLLLEAPVCPGVPCKLTVAPHVIRFSSEDAVLDEEWPFGRPLFTGCGILSPSEFTLLPGVPEEADPPAVTGVFRGAEGWKPGNGVFVGDCMPYAAGGRYHVLYLKDRRHHKSKWGRGAHQWEHISTEDLVTWQIHPMAVPIDDPAEGSICTGSFLEKGGISWLFYTVRTVDGSPAPVRRSLSRDGYHFRKDPSFSFTLSSRYKASSARDPKVFAGNDGLYHMLVTTTLLEAGKGCLLHLVSRDLDSWEEKGPLYVAPGADEPECSDLFSFGEYTYLVFSLKGTGQYRYTRTPLTDWQIPSDPVIPCRSVPKAAVFRNRILFAGFEGEGGYAGHMTFRSAVPGPDGSLVFLPDSGVARHEPDRSV